MAPEEKISTEKIDAFYKAIDDEVKEIKTITDGWTDGNFKRTDLLKIGKLLGIVSKNPLFNSIGRADQLFIQVIRYLEIIETSAGGLDERTLMQNSKEMLKYIEKENILSNSTRILEQINELGIKNHQLHSQMTSSKKGNKSQLDSIRQKLAKGNVIKNDRILNNIAKTNRH